jgi:hypothetical protein
MPFLFTRKVVRTFGITSASTKSTGITHYVSGCPETLPCGETEPLTGSITQSENCVIETNVLYYMNRQKEIYLWKSTREEVSWAITSNKFAAFKTKWGMSHHHKICVPNTVVGNGTEKFFLSIQGVAQELASVNYTWNPFPVTDMAGGTWGLYGNVVDYSGTPADTPNVALILLYPLVPKLGIPYDNDVKHYGFYDYNAMDGGFVENSLPRDDGGKDYFYPYWCRTMSFDRLWRETADERYKVIYTKVPYESGVYVMDAPEYFEFPFLTVATSADNKKAYVSGILQFSDRAGGSGYVLNITTDLNVFEGLTKAGITLGKFTVINPMVAT